MTLAEPLLRRPAVQQEQKPPRRRRRWGCCPRPSVWPQEQPLQGRRQQPQKLRLHLRLWWRYRYRQPTSPSRPPSPLASASHLASWPPPLFPCLSLCVYMCRRLLSWPGGRRTESLLGLATGYLFFYPRPARGSSLCSPSYLKKGRHKMCSTRADREDTPTCLLFRAWLGGGGPY